MAARTNPYTGRCFCEATRFRVNAEPLTLYACHCTDCQKRTGSAFALSLWVPRAAVEATMGEPVARDLKGDTSWLRPVAHLWTRSAQPWFAFPEGVAKYTTQPGDFSELFRLWSDRAVAGVQQIKDLQ